MMKTLFFCDWRAYSCWKPDCAMCRVNINTRRSDGLGTCSHSKTETLELKCRFLSNTLYQTQNIQKRAKMYMKTLLIFNHIPSSQVIGTHEKVVLKPFVTSAKVSQCPIFRQSCAKRQRFHLVGLTADSICQCFSSHTKVWNLKYFWTRRGGSCQPVRS
jgi:hypothetical protein